MGVNQPDTNGLEIGRIPPAPGWPKRNIPFGDGESAGGWPFSASNAWLLKGTGGQPELYSCGLTIHNKVAQALAKLAIITGGVAKAPLEELPQGAQFVDWTNADPKTRAAVTDPEAFEAERQKLRDEHATKTSVPEGPKLTRLEKISQLVKAALDKLPGGEGDNVPASAVDPKELAEGVKEEAEEHTTDKAVAKEIAIDHLVKNPYYYTQLKKLEKQAAEREPAVAEHDSAPEKQLRSRAEVIVRNADGQIWSIDKGDYLLFPGGGIDDGEHPEHTAVREVLEELGHNVVNLAQGPVVESIWPEGHPLTKDTPFKGERSHFFVALDAGDAGMPHADLEQFKTHHPQELINRLQELMDDPKQAWAKANNKARLLMIGRAGAGGVDDAPMKLAAAPVPGVLPDPNRQYVQGLVSKLQQRTAQKQPTQPVTGSPAAPKPAAGGLPSEVFQPSASQAISPAPPQPMPQAALRQTPSQLKHSSIDPVEIQAWLIEKLGQSIDLEGLDSGEDNNSLTPKPMAMNKNVEGNIHGLPQAAQQIGFAQADVKAKTTYEPTAMTNQKKVADVVRVLPKKQFLLFTPDGKLVVRRLPNKRFTLPEQGEGRPAPYEPPIRFTPETGVPEAGYHGYDVGLHIGQTQAVPEGYEAADPQSVLSDLYGGMGLSANRPYMQLDRARGRAILRHLRKLKPKAVAPGPVQTVAP